MISDIFAHTEKCRYCEGDTEVVFCHSERWGSSICDGCLTTYVFIRTPNNHAQLFNYSVFKKLDDKAGYRFTYTVSDDLVIVEYYVVSEPSGLRDYTSICIIDKYISPDDLFDKMEGLKVFS